MQIIVSRLQQLYKKKMDTDQNMLNQIKSHYFVSAEGAYSAHIFNTYRTQLDSPHYNPKNTNNYKILIAGRMMSDKITKPVVWKVNSLSHC
jgi:hypothetical protein